MESRDLRDQATALVTMAGPELEKGETEAADRMIDQAQEMMQKADSIDATATRMKALQGDFERPLNTVPVTSNDVAIYDPMPSTSRTKADYKPASFVKGLPAMAQPLWVQEQMGDNLKDEARFMSDTFIKWMKSPSDDVFWKTASSDEIKAMQEDTDAEGGFFVPEQFLANTIHDP